MNEKELKELERLAKAAMEQNPEETEGILEQALMERKDEMWQTIRKRARREVRLRRARPWIAAASMVMVAVIISGVVGVNQARAGKDGLLVDIVEGVAGGLTFSDEPVEFLPIMLEDGTWEDIMDNIDPALIPLLPDGLPEEYVFQSGSINQPSRDKISMRLKYGENNTNYNFVIYYIYNSEDNVIDMEEYEFRQWEGTDVHIMINDRGVNIAWQQNGVIINIIGVKSEEVGRILFNAIKKEP